MPTVRAIYRYPVKGLSPEALPGIELEAGKPFPFDRVFALVRPGLPYDTAAPRWAKKGLFLMLMLDEALARVRTHVDPETLLFSVFCEVAAAGGTGSRAECVLSADLGSSAGRARVEAFFRRELPALSGAPRLVHAPAGHFMDKPENVISLINLATLRSLESDWGTPVHPLRFRANFYIDGAEPWQELEWVGRELWLGDVRFRVHRRNGRCGATNVNPLTAERDMDIPGALRARFGHKDLGIYLLAQTGGRVAVGDDAVLSVPSVAIGPARTPEAAVSTAPGPTTLAPGAGRFICRGCYFIYTESAESSGEAAPFAQLDDAWRCPDCGTDKHSFRPYLPSLG